MASKFAQKVPQLGRKPVYLSVPPFPSVSLLFLTNHTPKTKLHTHPPKQPQAPPEFRILHRPAQPQQTRLTRLPMELLRYTRARRAVVHPDAEDTAG